MRIGKGRDHVGVLFDGQYEGVVGHEDGVRHPSTCCKLVVS